MKLIDKDAVLAEIERRKQTWQHQDQQYVNGGRDVCDYLLGFLDTLEVKEVDIEDSIKETLAQKYIDYTFRRHNIDPESKEGQLIYYAYMHGMNQCLTQLRTQKRE